MSAPRHIEIRSEEGRVLLVADDYELFDFLDDYLTEKDAGFEYMSEERRGGRTFYTMCFPIGTSVELVQSLVAEIPESEIQRIWEINNTKQA